MNTPCRNTTSEAGAAGLRTLRRPDKLAVISLPAGIQPCFRHKTLRTSPLRSPVLQKGLARRVQSAAEARSLWFLVAHAVVAATVAHTAKVRNGVAD